MAEFLLSAFADEAGKTLEAQIIALKENGFTHIEPRNLDYGNISEYTAAQCKEVRKALDAHGIGVSAIGSPFGKIGIREDFAPHFDLFKRNVENAAILGAARIRMFSFYFDADDSYEVYRDEVFERLDKMADYALSGGISCCHENEKGIYGDTDDRCLDILTTFAGKIKGVFDPANFIQCGVEILPAYAKLEPYIDYLHIKDCLYANSKVVPAGKGDGHIKELLTLFAKKDGKRFLTLEPHLKVFDGLAALEKKGETSRQIDDYTYPTNRAAFDAAAEALRALL
ncbi:MAG: sugar phosphate isomerase/epimerase [Clostridia bacterium]|nr:sugar phosphate isomerase/epimerase [Clostridia bacterium]